MYELACFDLATTVHCGAPLRKLGATSTPFIDGRTFADRAVAA